MAYIVYCDDEPIYDLRDETLVLIDPVIELELNSAGSFTFTMPPTHPLYDLPEKLNSRILVEQDGEEIFKGRIIQEKTDFWKRKEIVCEGELAFLNDTILRPAEYHDITPREYLETVIESHNSQVDEDRQFTVGIVTVEDSNDSMYCYNNMNSTMTEIKEDLVDDLGGYLKVRNENGVRYLDYVNIEDYGNTSTQPIEFGTNLLDFTSDIDMTDICTGIIPLGELLEDSDFSALDVRLTIEDVNDGVDYIQIDEAVEQYGLILKTVEWDSVTTSAALLTKGKAYLEDYQWENMTIEASAVDMHLTDEEFMSFRLGDYIQVVSTPHGLNRYFPLSKMTINLASPSSNTVTLGESEDISLSARTSTISSGLDSVSSAVPSSYSTYLQTAINQATALITAATHGYVMFNDIDDDGYPDELLIMDTDDTDTATKVWRWNLNGLGYSSTGYNGTYGTAITMDGQIVADYVATGTMYADRIKGGTLTLGGTGNAYGQISILDSDGDQIGYWNESGIFAKGTITAYGSFTIYDDSAEDTMYALFDSDGVDIYSDGDLIAYFRSSEIRLGKEDATSYFLVDDDSIDLYWNDTTVLHAGIGDTDDDEDVTITFYGEYASGTETLTVYGINADDDEGDYTRYVISDGSSYGVVVYTGDSATRAATYAYAVLVGSVYYCASSLGYSSLTELVLSEYDANFIDYITIGSNTAVGYASTHTHYYCTNGTKYAEAVATEDESEADEYDSYVYCEDTDMYIAANVSDITSSSYTSLSAIASAVGNSLANGYALIGTDTASQAVETSSPYYALGTRDLSAIGAYSTTFGYELTGNRAYQTVIGKYNEESSAIFVVAFGTSGSAKNVFTVGKKGAVKAAGRVTASKFVGDLKGTSNYSKALSVSGSIGSSTQPVYINSNGKPVVCNAYSTISSGLTESEVNSLISDALSDYVTSDTLSNYVTSTSLSSTLSNYVTTSTLSNYVTTSTLSSYVTTSALSETLSDYITADSLSDSELSVKTLITKYIQIDYFFYFYGNGSDEKIATMWANGSNLYLNMVDYDDGEFIIYFNGLTDSFIFDQDAFFCKSSGSKTLGTSSYLWSTIYSSSSSISTSDENKKHDISDVSDVYLDLFDKLRPVTYVFNDGKRTHTGFISQEVEQALDDVGLTADDFAAFCKDENEDGGYDYGLRYEEIIALNTAAIKRLEAKIKELERSVS